MSRRAALPLAALVSAALFAVAYATIVAPWLTRERTFISSTPTALPETAITNVRLRTDAVVCVRGFGLSSTASGLQLVARRAAERNATPPLRVEVRAPGYRSSTVLPGGYAYDDRVVVALRPPEHDVDEAQVCIRNEGMPIALAGTEVQGELSAVTVQLDGSTIRTQPWLTFVERRPASILGRHARILDHVAAFRPFPAVPPLLAVLALLVALGVPIAVVGALALAQRTDGDA